MGPDSFLNTARCGGITVVHRQRLMLDGITVAGIDEPAGPRGPAVALKRGPRGLRTHVMFT